MKKKFDNYFNESPKVTFLVMCFIIFMFTYGIVFNKMTFNHDSVGRVYTGLWYQANGRFLREPLTDIMAFATYSPIVNSLFLFSSFYIATILQTKLYDVKSLFSRVLMFATNVTYPIFALYWSYDNDMWEYIFAYMLMNVALYFLFISKSKYKDFFSCAAVVGGLAIYQAVISPLVVLWAIYWIIKGLVSEVHLKEIFSSFGKLVLYVIIYYLCNVYIEFVFDVQRNTYMNGDEVGLKFLIQNIPQSIVESYNNFWLFMTNKIEYLSNIYHKGIIKLLVISCGLILPLIMKARGYSNRNVVISAVILMVLPILINAIYFITQIDLIRIQFGFIGIYLLFVLLFIEYEVIVFKVNWMIIPVLYIILTNYQITAQALNVIVEKNQQDIFVANTIYTDLTAQPNFDMEDEIVFCGTMANNSDYQAHSWYPYAFVNYDEVYAPGVTNGIYKGLPDAKVDYQYHFTYLFLRLGYYLNIEEGDCNFEQPYYPQDGYIEEQKDTWYIRLGSSEILGY